MLRKIKNLLLILFVNLATASSAFAANGTTTKRPPIIPDCVPDPDTNKTCESTLYIPTGREKNPEQYFGGAFLPNLTKTVIAAAGGMAVLFIIIGGIQILTAYGSDEKISSAKKTITYAIVGLLIAILSYAIVTIISSIQIGATTTQPPAT